MGLKGDPVLAVGDGLCVLPFNSLYVKATCLHQFNKSMYDELYCAHFHVFGWVGEEEFLYIIDCLDHDLHREVLVHGVVQLEELLFYLLYRGLSIVEAKLL